MKPETLCEKCGNQYQGSQTTKVCMNCSIDLLNAKDAKIWACYVVYNNADYLGASFESLIRFVDYIIVIDGRYQTYPAYNNTDWSTDGTNEIIHDYLLKYDNIICVPCPVGGWETQVQKRNAYLSRVPVGDWILVNDGDEILSCRDWPAARKEIDECYEDGRALVSVRYYSDRFRLFVKTEGMAYKDYHWNVDDGNGRNIVNLVEAATYAKKPIKNMTTIHMKHQREERVIKDKEIFYKNRKPIEDPHIMRDMVKQAKQMKEDGVFDEVEDLEA